MKPPMQLSAMSCQLPVIVPRRRSIGSEIKQRPSGQSAPKARWHGRGGASTYESYQRERTFVTILSLSRTGECCRNLAAPAGQEQVPRRLKSPRGDKNKRPGRWPKGQLHQGYIWRALHAQWRVLHNELRLQELE